LDYRAFGDTGLTVSALSFGASALGGVFRNVDEGNAIRAVHAALDAGITYFDVAPSYGATRSETILGKALSGIARDRYVLSTKVGKYSKADESSDFDYSAARIRAELDASAARLGTDRFDVLYIHDIEYDARRNLEAGLGEALDTVQALKAEGRTQAVGYGMYPIDLWARVLRDYPVDAALIHNHGSLHDTRLADLMPLAEAKGVGVVNASPFASGLLTERGPADWHPATPADRAVAARAAALCREHGSSIEKLSVQYSAQSGLGHSLMFSTANPDAVLRNIGWATEPFAPELVAAVRAVLAPVIDRDWY
jgi:L-galactose dehydrogenase